MRTHVLAAAAVLASASFASADLQIGDFENSLTSPLGVWSVTGAGSGFSSSVGVSTGASSLSVQRSAQGFAWNIAMNGNEPLRDAILAHDKLAFDVTVPTGPQSPAFEYVVFLTSLNSNSTGWQQAGSNLVSSGGENAWNGEKLTFVWDYPQTAMNATSPWSQINIALNLGNISGSVPAVYIDNVRLIAIPEPASLSALGALGLAMARRRR